MANFFFLKLDIAFETCHSEAVSCIYMYLMCIPKHRYNAIYVSMWCIVEPETYRLVSLSHDVKCYLCYQCHFLNQLRDEERCVLVIITGSVELLLLYART